ncbi:MAG: DUF4157 domain-containing protein [Leptolyngbya sp.]|nr:DUF4157 domain-containing protein [Leptolyngbya sp.]
MYGHSSSGPAPVQAKLTVGAVGDQYEQEADRVAAQVVDHINSPGVQTAQDPGLQRESMPEEEELQMKPLDGLQRESMPEEEELQMKPAVSQQQDRPNQTGLPDSLKAGVEGLSGVAMDNVRVHYNSNQPAQLQALAYTQGSQIHVGPGQEKHLPHEAWHVVQQAQGRVKPTQESPTGLPINDDSGLEKEAEVMGLKAAKATEDAHHTDAIRPSTTSTEAVPASIQAAPIQMVKPANKAEALKLTTGSDLTSGYDLGKRHYQNHKGIELKAQLSEAGDTNIPSSFVEYDVNPNPGNRGKERIVQGDNGRIWYTDDHYKKGSFVELT